MKKTSLLLLTLFLSHLTGWAQSTTTSQYSFDGTVGIVAHRGFYKFEDASENSIAAMQHAVDHDFYGTEFDVQFTLDSIAIIYHDASIQGTPIAQMPYEKIMKLPQSHLKGGETIPTLDQFLQAYSTALIQQRVRNKTTRLFFEIKPPSNRESVEYIVTESLKAVKKYNLEKLVSFISFDLNVCAYIAKLEPDIPVAYLGGDITPDNLYNSGILNIDYHFEQLLANPHWIEEAHRLGMTVNAWTVNDPHIAIRLRELKVEFITTDLPLDMESWLLPK